MNFENRQNDWQDLLSEQKELKGMLTTGDSCKICICLELLKQTMCPAPAVNKDQVFGDLIQQLTRDNPALNKGLLDHLHFIEAATTNASHTKDLQEKITAQEEKIRQYEESINEIQTENRKFRSSFKKIREDFDKFGRYITHLSQQDAKMCKDRDDLQATIEKIGQGLESQNKAISELKSMGNSIGSD